MKTVPSYVLLLVLAKYSLHQEDQLQPSEDHPKNSPQFYHQVHPIRNESTQRSMMAQILSKSQHDHEIFCELLEKFPGAE